MADKTPLISAKLKPVTGTSVEIGVGLLGFSYSYGINPLTGQMVGESQVAIFGLAGKSSYEEGEGSTFSFGLGDVFGLGVGQKGFLGFLVRQNAPFPRRLGVHVTRG